MIDRPPSTNPTPAFEQASVINSSLLQAVPQMTLFISGPFGAGKSTVTRFVADELTARGHEVCTIILDTIGHELLDSDEKLRDILVQSFGEQILRSDGLVDRRALAAVGFADVASQTALNAITHPVILTRAVQKLTEYATADFCVFEAPLPISTLERTPGYGSEYLRAARQSGRVLAVLAPRALRLERVLAKGFSDADARARMAAQPQEEAYRACADLCLQNEGDLDTLRRDLSDLLDPLWR